MFNLNCKEEILTAEKNIEELTNEKLKLTIEKEKLEKTDFNDLPIVMQFGLKGIINRIENINTSIKINKNMIEIMKDTLESQDKNDIEKTYPYAINRDKIILQQIYDMQERGYRIDDYNCDHKDTITINFKKKVQK